MTMNNEREALAAERKRFEHWVAGPVASHAHGLGVVFATAPMRSLKPANVRDVDLAGGLVVLPGAKVSEGKDRG